MTHDTPTKESTTTDHAAIDELAERLQRSSVELATTDPTADHADLAPVGDALVDARIIGLGEATHGTREFFQLKHRIVRYLVEEQNLRLFVMEANLPETMALNDYIVHGEGDALEALAGTHFWVWRTEAVLALVEWLREFNAERPIDDRVRFYGIDAQYTTGAVEHLDEFLASADPDLREELQPDLAATDDEGNINDQYMSEHDPEATERLLDRLGTAFEERKEAFVTATSERETVMARAVSTSSNRPDNAASPAKPMGCRPRWSSGTRRWRRTSRGCWNTRSPTALSSGHTTATSAGR